MRVEKLIQAYVSTHKQKIDLLGEKVVFRFNHLSQFLSTHAKHLMVLDF